MGSQHSFNVKCEGHTCCMYAQHVFVVYIHMHVDGMHYVRAVLPSQHFHQTCGTSLTLSVQQTNSLMGYCCSPIDRLLCSNGHLLRLCVTCRINLTRTTCQTMKFAK